jgi:hypothetical protein
MKEEEIRKILSKNLRTYRNNLGLSQMDLAAKAGIATNFLNDIENGKKWIILVISGNKWRFPDADFLRIGLLHDGRERPDPAEYPVH